jgi:hypothetical protein
MAKKKTSTKNESFSVVRAGSKYFCRVQQDLVKPAAFLPGKAKPFAEALAKTFHDIGECFRDSCSALNECDDFVNFVESTGLTKLTAAFGEDAEAFSLAFTNRLEVDEIDIAEGSRFLDSFIYSAKDLRYEDSSYGIWLSPNLPTALADIDSLLQELTADGDKWRAISRMLEQPKNKLARSIAAAAGEDLKQDVKGLEQAFRLFTEYEIAEV